MLKALLYLNADLASSIALRYACHLAYVMDMEITPFHVASDRANGRAPAGSGWVRRTWEEGLIRQAQEEIAGLIHAENLVCPELKPPTVRLGKAENELLREVSGTAYDLFIMGQLHTFSARQFHQRLHSKFYRNSRCPILLVKNLLDLKRVALLVEPEENGTPQARTFVRVLKGLPVEVDLLSCVFKKNDDGQSDRLAQESLSEADADRERAAGQALSILRENHSLPDTVLRLEGTPKAIGGRLADYHLVLTSLPPHIAPTSMLLDCLSRVPSALLFCRE